MINPFPNNYLFIRFFKANVVDKREMREFIDDFIAEIREKAERGNYLPGELRNGKITSGKLLLNMINFIQI